MKDLWKAALIRTERTALQYIVASLPPGAAVTPALLQNLDWNRFKYVVAAWLVIGVLECIATFASALLTGLPEVDDFDMIAEDENDERERTQS